MWRANLRAAFLGTQESPPQESCVQEAEVGWPLPPGRQHPISLLAGELHDYVAALDRREVSWRSLFSESGLCCPRCRSTRCARFHGWWQRKRVIDLSTGEVFADLPICRVIFCDSSTQSLCPAELWRGKATITSVVEAVVHMEEEGMEAAWEWCRIAADRNGRVVSRRTLRRWREAVTQRLMPSASSWACRLVCSGSAADQVKQLLETLRLDHLLSFRVATGRAMLDKTLRKSGNDLARSSARPVPGRLDPSPPHETPRSVRPRGSWSPHSPRGSPSGTLPGERKT